MKPTTLRPSDIKEIIRLYLRQAGIIELARRFRVRNTTVRKILLDAGVVLRTWGAARLRKRISTEQIVRLYVKEHQSAIQITKELKINQKTVIHRLKAAGVKLRTPSESASLRPVKHGMADTPEYRIYISAKSRCTNPRSNSWKWYGGRGIKFLFKSFEDFYRELGRRPSEKHSVDRYPNPDGNYESGNVRWATAKQQAQTQRIRVRHPAIEGHRHPRAKLTFRQAEKIRRLYATGQFSQQEIGKQFSIGQDTISKIVSKRAYRF